MTDEVEHELLRLAQEGDLDAYEELQLRLEPDIRRFVRRLIHHVYAEDDIVQEVFIAFYQNMHKIDPVQNLRPYIFRIARNRCYDDLRRLERRDTISLDDEPVQMHVSFTEAHKQPKPDDITHWLLLHLEVREAMEELPEVQRQTLILFSEEGLAYAEIAEAMGVSIGTVKSRLYYAKKNLRGYLRPETVAVLDQEFGADDKSSQTTEATNNETPNNETPSNETSTETPEENNDHERLTTV